MKLKCTQLYLAIYLAMLQPVYTSHLVRTNSNQSNFQVSVNAYRIEPNCVEPLCNGPARDVGLV